MRSPLFGKNPNTLAVRATLAPYLPRPGLAFGEGPEVPLLQMHGEDDDARTLVVCLQPVFGSKTRSLLGLPQPFPVAHGPCVGLIEWGTGSATVFAEVDIAKGQPITLAASTVVLTARNDGNVQLAPDAINEFGVSLPPLPIDALAGPQEVVAMIGGAGTRPASTPATRTYYRGRLPSGETATFPVPPFAKSVLVSRAPLTTTLGVSLSEALANGKVRDGEHVLGPGEVPPPLAMFDLADHLIVRNLGAETISFLQAQFILSL
jgi:hypothetical protein